WDDTTANAYSFDNSLLTDPMQLSAGAQLTFRHWFALEASGTAGTTTAYDAGVLEISTDNGATWKDLGSAVTSGGYNKTVSAAFGSPIAGRAAWSGQLNGTGTLSPVVVDLSSYTGQTARIRFRLATDTDNSA